MARTTLAVTVCKDLLLIVAFAVMLALATSNAMSAKAAADESAGVAAAQTVDGASADTEPGSLLDPGENPGAADRDAGADDGGGGLGGVAWKLTKQLGGSMLAGLLIGFGLAWYVKNVNEHLPILLVLGSFAVALVSKELGLKTLIVGLSAGLTMANLYAQQAHTLLERVEELAVPVYAIFFAVAGTKVDPAQLAGVWYFVIALVGLRTLAIWGGTTLGCRVAGMEPPASRWLWTGFVPQAGISLALAVVVADQFSGFAFSEKVFAILISAIAVHELAGPVLFKFALGRAGEADASKAKG